MTARLAVEHLTRSFGGLAVTRDVSLTLADGDRVALIGPNGAGKTTFVNLVTGALAPSAGRIVLAGEDVTTLGMEARVQRGLVRSFQVTRLFRDLTVRENVALAVLLRRGCSHWMFRAAARDRETQAEAERLLALLRLSHVAARAVREIAYGEQRLLEIVLALALQPKVLLLDEPAAGVPKEEASRVLDAIAALPEDIAILLIEHDMDMVFRFARRVVVLAAGSVIFEGDPAAVSGNEWVRQAYLGSYSHVRRTA